MIGPGTTLGNFVIDAEIGRGRFGIVYRAHNQTAPGVRRAIKVLHPDAEPELAPLFEREARILASLDSPRVCQVHDVGVADGRPYLVMELLEGETLAQSLLAGPLPVDTALDHLRQICEGLAAVHARGHVHRDVKPSNIFVTRGADGVARIKLLDFNIAKGTEAVVGPSTLSHHDGGPGTARYMSPEQIFAPGKVDARTDLWAAGVVLFEMLTGAPPFDGETPGSIHRAIDRGERAPLPAQAQVAQRLVDGCLAPYEGRFASVGQLLDQLAALAPVATALALPAREPLRPLPSESAGVRLRNALARRWYYPPLAQMCVGLALLLGSFALQINDYVVGDKRVGYFWSLNWTLVHTFLGPIALALLGWFLRTATATMAQLGPGVAREWDRRAQPILVASVVLSLLFALGYTAVEWSHVLTGRCEGGQNLGWPNQLCVAARSHVASFAFLGFAAVAQAIVMVVAWAWFCVVVATCEVVFAGAAPLPARDARAVARLFEIATWGWAAQFVGLYLARLWSFHLQATESGGLVDTLITGLPGSLFDIHASTQPDVGSMIAGTIIYVAAAAPFLLLRMRSDAGALVGVRRAAVAVGVVGLVATVFPRLGAFCLLAIAVAAGVARLGRRAR